MRKSSFYLAFVIIHSVVFLALVVASPLSRHEAHRRDRHAGAGLVRNLRLTDLCLFTEARYTRHVTQADLHSAFQDHPMAMEHFPSGSLILPTVEGNRHDEGD